MSTQLQSVSSNANGQSGIVSLSSYLKRVGRSSTTGWRWVRSNWLHPVNIAGRPYLTVEDILQFEERAKRGEFARPFNGAARKSADERASRGGVKELTTTK